MIPVAIMESLIYYSSIELEPFHQSALYFGFHKAISMLDHKSIPDKIIHKE
jgi:hypothetical protein